MKSRFIAGLMDGIVTFMKSVFHLLLVHNRSNLVEAAHVLIDAINRNMSLRAHQIDGLVECVNRFSDSISSFRGGSRSRAKKSLHQRFVFWILFDGRIYATFTLNKQNSKI